MTLNEANKIVQIYGKYLEYIGGKLLTIFCARIPQSLLPYPKDVLEEALNIMAEYHHKAGNHNVVNSIQTTIAALIGYVDDEEAILQAAKNFNEPGWRKTMLSAIKKSQHDWIKMQQNF